MTASASQHVVVISGGRGGAHIAQQLVRQKRVRITLLINAFDDGKSTGALRRYIPGMLGPSDVRKNLSQLAAVFSRDQVLLRDALEWRLCGDSESISHGMEVFCESRRVDFLPPDFGDILSQVAPDTQNWMAESIGSFLRFQSTQAELFDWHDSAFGNILFAGIYLAEGRDFNAACASLGAKVAPELEVLNVTDGENRTLRGIASDGRLLMSEAEVICPGGLSSVDEIALHSHDPDPAELEYLASGSRKIRADWLREHNNVPKLDAAASEALLTADAIVIAPGTPHSSIFPTLMVLGGTTRRTQTVPCVYIANLTHDEDIFGYDNYQLVERALHYSGWGEGPQITHVLLDPESDLSSRRDGAIAALGPEVMFVDIRNPLMPSRHSAFETARFISRIISSGLRSPVLHIVVTPDVTPDAVRGLVDEFHDIPWSAYFAGGLLYTSPAAEPVLPIGSEYNRSCTHHQSDNPLAAIARIVDDEDTPSEDVVLILSGDGRYLLSDALPTVAMLRNGDFGMVIGSRIQNRHQLSSSLRDAYGDSAAMRRLAVIGATLVSLVTRLRTGVWLSDPLSGFRVTTVATMRRSWPEGPLRREPPRVAQVSALGLSVGETPIRYLTLRGFTTKRRRVNRGIRALVQSARGSV